MNPTHSEYCHCECPAGNSYAKLEETLNRVRMLHTKLERDGYSFCTHCVHPDIKQQLAFGIWDEFAPWPCDTFKALQGDDDV